MCVADVFLVCNYGILPAWALLILAPKSVWTKRVVHSMLVPVVLGTVYLTAFIVNPESPDGDFSSLEGVMKLFTEAWIVLAGWVHYLIFDLFIGAWEVRDAERHELSHLLVVPCLLLTLMLGPIGLASYLLLRFALRRDAFLDEGQGVASSAV